MIEEKDFWGAISDEVKEYLSMKYFGLTRCLLNDEQKKEISVNEIKFMSFAKTDQSTK